MIKKVTLSVFLLIIIGCSTSPNIYEIAALHPGITWQEMIGWWGKPNCFEVVDDQYVLGYDLYHPNHESGCLYHFYFNMSDELVSWEGAFITTEDSL